MVVFKSIYSFMINTYEYRPPRQVSTKIAFDPCLKDLEKTLVTLVSCFVM